VCLKSLRTIAFYGA